VIYAPGVKALIYIEAKDDQTYPEMSERIIFTGELRPPEPPANPDQFDYAGYLKTKGILYTCFIKAGDWRIIGK